MQFKGLSFPDAKTELAREIGIETREDPRKKTAREQEERAIAFSTLVRDIFHQGLSSPAAQNTVRYFAGARHRRGRSQPLEARFWCPHRRALPAHRSCGIPQTSSKRLDSDEDGSDLFENRLVFPIEDGRGRVIAFGARRIGDQARSNISMLETQKDLSEEKDTVWLVSCPSRCVNPNHSTSSKGFDVIACHRVGLTNTVASLGTAFAQSTPSFVVNSPKPFSLAMDRDSAGDEVFKSGRIPPRTKAEVQVVGLPEGEDPDSLLRTQGRQALEQLRERRGNHRVRSPSLKKVAV